MIKKLINPGNYDQHISIALLFLRITIGVFMLTHGTGKLITVLEGGPIQFPDPIGLGAAASLALAVFAEFICSLLLIFGVATRFAAIPLILTMLVAAFIVHADDTFAVKEKALLFLIVYITIAITGAGKLSLDRFINSKINSK